ncbi:MAG: class I SAM-dependent methyltransferase [Rubrivivax sp.]|nr:class I SAM-dependent methyltransferase [Rubrivivax sp.]
MNASTPAAPPTPARLPWPLPALLVWLSGWLAAGLLQQGGAASWALAGGTATAAAASLAIAGGVRRLIAALGFPLSAVALAWVEGPVASFWWLAALAPLALAYPLRAWRDAPFFPTPAGALQGIERIVQPAPGCVLDAGCGLGHGLAALGRAWPQARLQGVEWSAPMAWLAARRLRCARIERADMWAASWAAFDLVYLFQRPETMARAWAKAAAEIGGRPGGGWLVSLEFAVPGVEPAARLQRGGGRPVYVYRIDARSGRRRRSTAVPAGR